MPIPAVQPRAVVLVEGISDQQAIEALAERQGRNLEAEGVSVLSMGGAQAIGLFLGLYGPRGKNLGLAGVCDVQEEDEFRRGLERAGLGSNLTRADMERLGFYVCVRDLEDELIRAHGAASVERIVEAQGDLRSFRTLQKQPAWQGQPVENTQWWWRTPRPRTRSTSCSGSIGPSTDRLPGARLRPFARTSRIAMPPRVSR